ncbi:hypothetical protein FCV25MIE_33371, partial [Fagus crenata]
SIAHNVFSGTIPKELGNLKELTMLSFASNNFSGTLPPELGNLVKLEQMWASDIPFTGRIPEFIGNWTKLTTLQAIKVSEKYGYYNTTVKMLVQCFVGEFKETLLKGFEFQQLNRRNTMWFVQYYFSSILKDSELQTWDLHPTCPFTT